jgi:hypothetical protein
MANPPMNDGDQVVTRDILRQELARYPTREELKEELARFVTRDDFGLWMQTIAQQHDLLVAAIAELGQAMKASHDALFVEIGRAARVAAEENRRELGVLDDRYRDLPDRVTALETDLDAHRRDAALHRLRPRRPRR